jgi:hypothetical protein
MARKTKETNAVSNPTFTQLRFYIPTSVSPFFRAIGPIAATFAPCGIQWVGDDTLHGVLHESAKEDKGKEFVLRVSHKGCGGESFTPNFLFEGGPC